ncbi:MAG: hypothetical protein ABEI74_01225 [Candidatus Pacearchaeota archaeon]
MLILILITVFLIALPQISAYTKSGKDVFNIGEKTEGEFSIGGTPLKTIFTGQKESQDGGGTGGGGSRGGAGGGDGYISQPPEEEIPIETIPQSYNTKATVGVNRTSKITIKNTGNETKTVKIEPKEKSLLNFEKNTLSIEKGGTKIVDFNINTPNKTGIFTTKITLTTEKDNGKIEVPFALNVNSKAALFDIGVKILDEDRRIKIGKNLKT